VLRSRRRQPRRCRRCGPRVLCCTLLSARRLLRFFCRTSSAAYFSDVCCMLRSARCLMSARCWLHRVCCTSTAACRVLHVASYTLFPARRLLHVVVCTSSARRLHVVWRMLCCTVVCCVLCGTHGATFLSSRIYEHRTQCYHKHKRTLHSLRLRCTQHVACCT